MPEKIIEISYNCPEKVKEIYFCGERIYKIEELRDRLAKYMAGYTEVEIEYKILEKSYSRDIVNMDEAGKRQELEELYDSLKKIVK